MNLVTSLRVMLSSSTTSASSREDGSAKIVHPTRPDKLRVVYASRPVAKRTLCCTRIYHPNGRMHISQSTTMLVPRVVQRARFHLHHGLAIGSHHLYAVRVQGGKPDLAHCTAPVITRHPPSSARPAIIGGRKAGVLQFCEVRVVTKWSRLGRCRRITMAAENVDSWQYRGRCMLIDVVKHILCLPVSGDPPYIKL